MRAALRARAVELLANERSPQADAAPPAAQRTRLRELRRDRCARGDRFCSQCGAQRDARGDAAL